MVSLNKMPFKPATKQTDAPTHLSFGEQGPPKAPLRANIIPAAQAKVGKKPLQKRFDTLAEQGSRSDDMDS
jgi:hypothetical protein